MSAKPQKNVRNAGRKFTKLVQAGAIRPEHYPGRGNQAYRLLIRSIRAAHTQT